MPLESLLANFHFGEHNALQYSSIAAFHQLLVEYARFSLKSSNEILLVLTSPVQIENSLSALKKFASDIVSHQKDGSLVIRDPAKVYFNLVDELIDILIMI